MKTLAALLAAPALPANALMAAPAAGPMVPPNLYTWSAMIARTQGKCTTDMLVQTLNIDTARATGLVNRLIANNVIGTASSVGVGQAKHVLTPEPENFFEGFSKPDGPSDTAEEAET